NSTCLLFFGGKIGEDNVGADFHWLVQEKQTAMRVYHDCFAVLAEVLAVRVLARSAHGDAYPKSHAAPISPGMHIRHDPSYGAGRPKVSQGWQVGECPKEHEKPSNNKRRVLRQAAGKLADGVFFTETLQYLVPELAKFAIQEMIAIQERQYGSAAFCNP